MTAHIGESAELYALGALGEDERAQVDAHVVQCDACAARLGEAERTIAVMEDGSVAAAMRPVRAWRFPAALAAAAFVLGLVPSAWFWSAQQHANAGEANRESAIVALVSSHFSHAPFQPLAAAAPKAKLLYARNGRWVYVVAETGKPLLLKAQAGGAAVTLGALRVSGESAELFVRDAGAARSFVLNDGRRDIERVTLPAR